jgi:rhodanese-related sulfurtransferase/peroxiredoxin
MHTHFSRMAIFVTAVLSVATFAADPVANSSTAPAEKKPIGPPTLVGQKAPDFTLKALDGTEVTLSKQSGNVVVLDFWLVGCVPCMTAFPHLQTLAGDAELAKKGLRVWAINTPDTPADAKAFATERKLTLPVFIDEGQAATKSYGAMAFPTTIIVGRDGVILAAYTGHGEDGDKKLDELIAKALGEKTLGLTASNAPATAPVAESAKTPAAGAPASPTSVALVSPDEFQKLIAKGEGILIDVRTPGEYALGHLANSVNINLRAKDFAEQMQKLDKSKTYLVYCASGGRSTQACDKMSKSEFPHLYNLKGGIDAWKTAGKPTVTTDTKP